MKTRKPLWKVTVTTTLEAEDGVGQILGRIFGGIASSFYDFEKQSSRVTVFLSHKIASEQLEALGQGIRELKECGLETAPGRISAGRVRQEDWAESWKRHFKPIEIANKLLIKPGWSKKRPKRDQAVVVLNPGLSFGTGQHPTTLYCLEEMVRNLSGSSGRGAAPKNGQTFFDIGTGSAILAIAAAKLGYKKIKAIDFDPEALRVARANTKANGVLKKIRIQRGDVTQFRIKPQARYDFICANLISNLLINEGKRIIAQLNRDGVLVLAGILKSEFGEVQRAYEKRGLKLISSRTKKEWRSGTFCFAKFFER